ncbi:MAG: inositol monophosphatase family protein [Lentisphaeria bacterium]|nr:inositol monophosphatase family protein [Lentisphaeria bacterium]
MTAQRQTKPETLVKLGRIARDAGVIVRRYFEHLRGDEVSHKGATDIVTVADREVERYLQQRLHEAFPDVAFYGEEGHYAPLATYERVFIVDPIDGTTSFVHGHPFHAVSLGLREEGQTSAGVVYLPYFDQLYWAGRGQGAWKDGRRLRVSANADMLQALGGTGFGCVRAHAQPDNVPMLSEMIYRLRGFRTCGSAAIDLCYVAEGHYDVYWEYLLQPYDWEAGALIVEEAGGRVTGFDGQPPRDDVGRILATNGLLHHEMMDIVAKHS